MVSLKIQGQTRKGVRNTSGRGRFRCLLTHRCGPGAPSTVAGGPSAYLWGYWYGGFVLGPPVEDPLTERLCRPSYGGMRETFPLEALGCLRGCGDPHTEAHGDLPMEAVGNPPRGPGNPHTEGCVGPSLMDPVGNPCGEPSGHRNSHTEGCVGSSFTRRDEGDPSLEALGPPGGL